MPTNPDTDDTNARTPKAAIHRVDYETFHVTESGTAYGIAARYDGTNTLHSVRLWHSHDVGGLSLPTSAARALRRQLNRLHKAGVL